MSTPPAQPAVKIIAPATVRTPNRRSTGPIHLTAQGNGQSLESSSMLRQAELFYLQKQIQSQTPMVLVLEDGEQLEGCIEWYDRSALKLRGRQKTLIYKAAIKYMYKQSDAGQAASRD
ncbi:MAG: RNA chaperone Hfq [Terracidiphilus sp.]|jgi:sRNA-binding regulator protein Hfq